MTTAGSLGDQLKCDNQSINQSNGYVTKAKARLVPRGDRQGIGSISTLSRTPPSTTTNRVAAVRRWLELRESAIFHVDVEQALVQYELNDEKC